jgi:hypothetical protein
MGGPLGGSSSSSQSDFYTIDRYNITLGNLLGKLAGYSRDARFSSLKK